MATGKALNGKPYAGNPHVRFDEGEVAPAATPRRGSLLYNTENSQKSISTKDSLVGALEDQSLGMPDNPTLPLVGSENVPITEEEEKEVE